VFVPGYYFVAVAANYSQKDKKEQCFALFNGIRKCYQEKGARMIIQDNCVTVSFTQPKSSEKMEEFMANFEKLMKEKIS